MNLDKMTFDPQRFTAEFTIVIESDNSATVYKGAGTAAANVVNLTNVSTDGSDAKNAMALFEATAPTVTRGQETSGKLTLTSGAFTLADNAEVYVIFKSTSESTVTQAGSQAKITGVANPNTAVLFNAGSISFVKYESDTVGLDAVRVLDGTYTLANGKTLATAAGTDASKNVISSSGDGVVKERVA